MSAVPSPCFGNVTMTIGSWSEANKKLGNGRYVKSDPISAGGHSWRIAFYPNGRLVGSTASMSLCLLLDDDATTATADEDIHVMFRFKMHEAWNSSAVVLMSSMVAAAFSRRRNAHGFERFVWHDDFKKTALFKSDRFTIRCQLTVVDPVSFGQMDQSVEPSVVLVTAFAPLPPPTPPPKPSILGARSTPVATPVPSASPAPSVSMSSALPVPPSILPEPPVSGAGGPSASVPAGQPVVRAKVPPPLPGLNADLGRLMTTKEGADVEFQVRGKVFPAHKCVFAARSPVFKDEFFGPAKEEDTSYVCVIPDMSSQAFEALLHYVYTDTLPPEMAMTSPEEGTAKLLAEDLLAAADRYELKDLKLLTEKKMCNHVRVSTVLPMLALAERYQCCKLKKMCLEFVGSCGKTRAVIATNDLETIVRSSPSIVKDVINEILDAREARIRRLITVVCIFAFFFWCYNK